MDLTPYVTALRDDLAAAASVGDEATARASTSLAAALEPAVRLTLMNALSDLAAEVSGALPDHSVDVRLHGREVDVVVHGSDSPSDGFRAGPSSSPFPGASDGGGSQGPGRPGGPGGPGGPSFGGGSSFGGGPDVGDISRMTLRIVDQIKGQAERAAAAQGMSLNSWVAQAVQGALRGQGGWPGSWGEHGDRGRGRSGEGWPGHGWSGRGWSGQGWPGEGWSGQGWPGEGRSGEGRHGDGGPGDGRPGDGRPGDGRPEGWSGRGDSGGSAPREDPPSGSGTDRASGSAPPSGDAPRGEAPGSRGDRRDDDPGDGGVQGWVRG